MTSNLKTPLDLELNLFENSFASKDLLHAHAEKNEEKMNPAATELSARSTATTMVSPNSLLIDRTSTLGTSSEVLEIRPATSAVTESVGSSETHDSGVKPAAGSEHQQTGSGVGNNKHNLRLLNFGNVNNERLPVITPPVFTPGGRRLPPIHLLPGLGIASPGTPGSNLWSSLLTATNGVGTNHINEQQTNQYTQPSYPLYMRKSGTITTESNLRSGLTPGIMNHAGFNFNIPDAMANGQMTPGLQTLLGLVNNQSVDLGTAGALPPATNENKNGSVAVSHTNSDLLHPRANTETQPTIAEEAEPTQPEPSVASKKEPAAKTRKRANKSDDSGKESKARKTSKSSASSKLKAETKAETKEAKDDEDGLDEEDKRKQFLERNRVAALKCRQRKKQQLSKMESELAFYSDGYRDLTAQVAQLRDQVMILRGILINHKDCPSLLNSLGSYQQLQNILALSDFLARGGKNSEPNYSTIPTTIPTILNNHPPVKSVDLMVMNGLEQMHAASHSINGLNPNGLNANGAVHSIHLNNGHGLTQDEAVANHLNRDQIPFDTSMAMNRQFSLANGHHPGVEIQQEPKGNLRPINSTSNLQHTKQESQMSGYDLRPIASMADLQPHNHGPGLVARQFQL